MDLTSAVRVSHDFSICPHEQGGKNVVKNYLWLLGAWKVEEEEVDYKPRYDPKGLEVIKTKDPEGLYSLVLSISEKNGRTNNILSHLYGMQILKLGMSGVTQEQLQQLSIDYPLSKHSRALYRVGPGFEEPFDDDDPTNDVKARVDFNLESDANDGEDLKIGELCMRLQTMRTRPREFFFHHFYLCFIILEPRTVILIK
ncbi:hypothetical protein HAX54_013994, partial [Datura stramonium]|nr:hypothetical protein [Datura stramonium]